MFDIRVWIREQFEKGFSSEEIKKGLSVSGYDLNLVDEIEQEIKLKKMQETGDTKKALLHEEIERERKGKENRLNLGYFFVSFICILVTGSILFFMFNVVKIKYCEFPETINGYNRLEIINILSQINEKPEGLLSWILVSYSDTNIIHFYTFETNIQAETYYNEMTNGERKYDYCELNDIKGLCFFESTYLSDRKETMGRFIWMERNIIKMVVTVSETDDENKLKEKMGIFISEFSNCKIKMSE